MVLKGVLRIALKVGLELDTGGIAPALNKTPFNIEAGIVAEVFANVAEFITNVTGSGLSSKSSKPESSDPSSCNLAVIQEYQFALGAGAGATVAVGFQTWGPMPTTSTPIFYTTLASACAIRKPTPGIPAPLAPTAPSSSSSAGLLNNIFNRQATPSPTPTAPLTTTTLTTTLLFTGQSCKSSGLINCPASLQISSTYLSSLTLITSIPRGVKATFPVTRFSSVPVESAVPFGDGAKKMISSTGVPTSFVPGPTGVVDDVKGWLEGSTGGLGNKVLLGVVVGLGVPVLVGVVAGIL